MPDSRYRTPISVEIIPEFTVRVVDVDQFSA
jgi:hypothetical protein